MSQILIALKAFKFEIGQNKHQFGENIKKKSGLG